MADALERLKEIMNDPVELDRVAGELAEFSPPPSLQDIQQLGAQLQQGAQAQTAPRVAPQQAPVAPQQFSLPGPATGAGALIDPNIGANASASPIASVPFAPANPTQTLGNLIRG